MTINVTSVNDEPYCAHNTVTTNDDTDYIFAAADLRLPKPTLFPYTTLFRSKMTTLPGAGALKNNGVAVTIGQFVSAADIGAGKLKFSPAAKSKRPNYSNVNFQ